MKILKTLILLFTAAAGTLAASAQLSNSAYSRIGYGLMSDNASGAQRAMGGVGYAMQSGRQINVMNPASYAYVDSLTFLWDVGVDFTCLWNKEGDKSGSNYGGGLDYITALFRVSKGMGMSFGVVPFSSVGYSFGTELTNGTESRTGYGGINELYLGWGYEPFKNFSFGANFSYMFGTTTNTTYVNAASTTMFQRVLEVRDWNVHVGAQYGINLNRDNRIVLGAAYTPKKSFHGHTWGTYHDESQDSKLDTVGYGTLKGRYQSPQTIGAGISFMHNDQLLVEADFLYQNWKDAKYTPLQGFESPNMTFDNRWKAAVGLQYTPNGRTSYLQRISYRIGGHYNHDYENISGNNVRDYSIGIGFGLPAPSSKTIINLGLEWKHRYSAPVCLIKENYLNITLSVNFNEMWFWKRQIQ